MSAVRNALRETPPVGQRAGALHTAAASLVAVRRVTEFCWQRGYAGSKDLSWTQSLKSFKLPSLALGNSVSQHNPKHDLHPLQCGKALQRASDLLERCAAAEKAKWCSFAFTCYSTHMPGRSHCVQYLSIVRVLIA
eukprot:2340416-Amphidinium_carterae.1